MSNSPLTRRALLGGLAGLAAAIPFTTAFGEPVISAYTQLPKAAWAWGMTTAGLHCMRVLARQQGLSRVLVSLSSPLLAALSQRDAATVGALRALSEDGIALVALLGDARWVTQPGSMPASVWAALRIHQQLGLFDALHLDIEPHTLTGWHGPDRIALVEGYLRLLTNLRRTAAGFPLEAAIHPSYASITLGDGGTLLARVAAQLSGVSIMAYRKHPAEAVKFAAQTIQTLEATGTAWRFGVLTHQSESAALSYLGSSQEDFQRDMVALHGMLMARSTKQHYRGLIFEDYNGLLDLVGAG